MMSELSIFVDESGDFGTYELMRRSICLHSYFMTSAAPLRNRSTTWNTDLQTSVLV